MGALTNYSINSLLNHMFGNSTYTPASNIYIALFDGDPLTTGTEISYTGYERKIVTFDSATNRQISNNNLITFAESDSSVSASHIAIYDNLTTGNMLGYASLTSVVNIASGNEPKISIGSITININDTTVGAGITDYTANKCLDLIFNNTSFSSPSMYFACSSTTINDDGSGFTEQTGTGYERILFSDFTTATSKALSNNSTITLYSPTADDQDIIVSLCVFDAISAGNMLLFDNDNVVDQTPSSGDTLQIKTGDFNITIN